MHEDHPMMAEQATLENEMRDVTIARYFDIHQKAADRDDFADTHAGRNVFNYTFSVFCDALQNWVAEREQGKAGRRSSAVRLIQDFGDTQTLAYIFLRHMVNRMMVGGKEQTRVTSTVLMATQAIHDEHRIRYFAENRKPLLRAILKDFQRRELPRRRRRELLIRQFNAQKLEWNAEGWGKADRVQLGVTLLDILIQATGMFELFTSRQGMKTSKCVRMTPSFEVSLLERMDEAAPLFTVFYPTVVPPKEWETYSLLGGGYYTENVTPYPLVKRAKIKYITELENSDMKEVVDPINAMQNTGWRVNPVMLNVLDHVYSHNLGVKGLPLADNEEVPPPPAGIDDDETLAAEYRKECYLVHDRNRRSISKRLAVLKACSLARKFSAYDTFYFPYDLDSRGRAYPKVPFLNPQGPDAVKALLEFSEGKPIDTPEQEAYLAIAIANAWGQDKLPLQDRVQWVEDNEAMLLEVAQNPQADRRWHSADEPFMALRGALEWLGLCEHGAGYRSHMPIHFDATCSGLQHFSALLLDEVGGFAVNLTGDDSRQDIYMMVAEKATETLKASDDPLAPVALEIGVSRSMCKRPVMIVPYAGTFGACMRYVDEYYREQAAEGVQFPMELDVVSKELVPMVARHVWEAISSTVIAARTAMDWITSTAKVASKDMSAPIQWSTPDGFVVQQATFLDTAKRIKTALDGERVVRNTISLDTAKLDARRMAQSLSPNYIHSFDACHMRMSIDRAIDLDKNMSFAMIHDSFGVHAADMALFVNECIKPAFVDMYTRRDNLKTFAREIDVNIPADRKENVRPLPLAGKLDIYGVLESQFFFS